MLQHVSEHVRECLARAKEAQRCAAETSDSDSKEDYLLAEQGWLRLADNHAASEQLERHLLEQDSMLLHRGEWKPAAEAPFDRDIEVAVIRDATAHAVMFPCRRILGG